MLRVKDLYQVYETLKELCAYVGLQPSGKTGLFWVVMANLKKLIFQLRQLAELENEFLLSLLYVLFENKKL